MIEELLSVRLLKEHSASDWSKRPLPDEWLTYAALDVELLIELRDRLAAELVETGKVEWAQEEFAALVAGIGLPVEARRDPWRRTSGIHKVRTRRGLAYVAELWHARDRDRCSAGSGAGAHPARRRDQRSGGSRHRRARTRPQHSAAHSWILPPSGPPVRGRLGRRPRPGRRPVEADLPVLHLPTEGPPQPRLWAAKDPIAAARLARIKVALAEISTAVNVPVENLLTPDYVRRVAWRPPDPISAESVDTALAALGARPWQRELTVPDLTAALIGSSAG